VIISRVNAYHGRHVAGRAFGRQGRHALQAACRSPASCTSSSPTGFENGIDLARRTTGCVRRAASPRRSRDRAGARGRLHRRAHPGRGRRDHPARHLLAEQRLAARSGCRARFEPRPGCPSAHPSPSDDIWSARRDASLAATRRGQAVDLTHDLPRSSSSATSPAIPRLTEQARAPTPELASRRTPSCDAPRYHHSLDIEYHRLRAREA